MNAREPPRYLALQRSFWKELQGKAGEEEKAEARLAEAGPAPCRRAGAGTCLPLGADLVITESWLQLH